jgi:hypothetical protein
MVLENHSVNQPGKFCNYLLIKKKNSTTVCPVSLYEERNQQTAIKPKIFIHPKELK